MPVNPFGQGSSAAGGGLGDGGWGGGQGQAVGGFGTAPVVDDDGEMEVVAMDGGLSNTSTTRPARSSSLGGGTGRKVMDTFKGIKVPGASQAPHAERWADVRRREAECERRERNLVNRQRANAPSLIKNWPKCYPIAHNDIAKDIPEENRSIMRMGYFVLLWTMTALVLNSLGILAVIAIPDVEYDSITGALIFAAIFVLVGCPGAWLLWYKPLYHGLRRDGAFTFAFFFLSFLCHIFFCGWTAVAPTFGVTGESRFIGFDSAGLGFMPALDLWGDYGNAEKSKNQVLAAALIYSMGTVMWGLLCFVSIILLGRVYRHFRGRPPTGPAQPAAV